MLVLLVLLALSPLRAPRHQTAPEASWPAPHLTAPAAAAVWGLEAAAPAAAWCALLRRRLVLRPVALVVARRELLLLLALAPMASGVARAQALLPQAAAAPAGAQTLWPEVVAQAQQMPALPCRARRHWQGRRCRRGRCGRPAPARPAGPAPPPAAAGPACACSSAAA